MSSCVGLPREDRYTRTMPLVAALRTVSGAASTSVAQARGGTAVNVRHSASNSANKREKFFMLGFLS